MNMQLTTLGNVVSVRSGFAFKSKDWKNTGVPVIKIANVKDGFILLEGCSFVDETVAYSAAAFELHPGDILISMTGYIGEIAMVRDEGRMLLNQRVGKFKIKDPSKLNNNYLFYCLRDPNLKAKFAAHAYGAAQPNISPALIEQQEILLPPLPTQRKIAAILSAYDDLIENNTRRIKILENMAQNLYQEWFVKFRFPGHEQVAFVDSPLGKIPEGWEVKTTNAVTSNYDRLRKPLSSMQRLERQGSYPYYGAAKIVDYIDSYIFDGVYLLLAEDGSVVTNDRKPVLQYVCGKFWANNHTHILQGKGLVSTEFLYLAFSNIDITAYITGAAQPKITQANLNRIAFIVPEDNTLIEFNNIIQCIFKETIALGKKNSILRKTRDLLLPKLISGELDVSNLDISIPEERSA